VTEELAAVPAQHHHSDQNFDIVLRGYDRNQVDRHISHLEQLLTEAQTEVARLQEGRPSYRELGGRIAQMLTLAEEQADQIRADATRATEDSRREARETAEATERDATERRAALDKEESERREQVKRDSEEATTAARERAGHIVAEAEHQADAVTAGARQELDRLGERRDEIRRQLEALRESLGTAVSGVVPPAVAEAAAPEQEHTTTVLPPAETETEAQDRDGDTAPG
jgi:chromosome segregation ATPase